MAIPITIPRLGWNMDEGLFAGWLKQDSDTIRAGDMVFSFESEKATEEIECLDSGILRIPADGPKIGDKLKVGTVIGYLVQAGEAPPSDSGTRAASPAAASLSAAAPASPSVRRLAREIGVAVEKLSGTGSGGRVTEADVQRFAKQRGAPVPADPEGRPPAISPRAKRIARELGIDWTRVQGSGRTGRVRERDIRAAAQHSALSTQHSVAITPIRRTIAERMLTSVRSTAPVTLTTTADATNLVNLRNQFKAVAVAGEVPAYTDFLVKLSAAALQSHPLLNSRWAEDQILILPNINIAIAVDTEAGLFAPVIRNVPSLSLRQVAAHARDLVERARQRKLKAEEMQDGTFTITNLGQFGIDTFTPIINYPQCAILGVGRIERRPVVISEQIVARDQITLSLTFDHRIVDGAPAARFLQTLGQLVENPGPALVP